MPRASPAQTRRTLCTRCDRALDVASAAKSVNCPHCHQRVITEPLVVKDYVAMRRFATANLMRITKKGIVYAGVRVDHLEIDGVLEGGAVALGTIRVGKTAKVKGDLRATMLSIEVGASLVGDVRIGPDQVPELRNLHAGPPQERRAATP